MLVVYGVPTGDIRTSGAVILDYVHVRAYPEGLYTTDVWDYDRDFAVRGKGRPTLLNLQSF